MVYIYYIAVKMTSPWCDKIGTPCLTHTLSPENIWVPSCFVPHLQLMKGEQQSARRNSGSQDITGHTRTHLLQCESPKIWFLRPNCKKQQFFRVDPELLVCSSTFCISLFGICKVGLLQTPHHCFKLWKFCSSPEDIPRLGGVVASRFRIYYTPEPAKARTPLDQLPSW